MWALLVLTLSGKLLVIHPMNSELQCQNRTEEALAKVAEQMPEETVVAWSCGRPETA